MEQITTSTKAVPTDVARGLRLMSKRTRSLHPRAQVQSLRKSAVIALGKAEQCREHAGKFGGVYAEDIARAETYERKAHDALAACLYLNRVHDLGYPVP